jgi:hypothetical protein
MLVERPRPWWRGAKQPKQHQIVGLLKVLVNGVMRVVSLQLASTMKIRPFEQARS